MRQDRGRADGAAAAGDKNASSAGFAACASARRNPRRGRLRSRKLPLRKNRRQGPSRHPRRIPRSQLRPPRSRIRHPPSLLPPRWSDRRRSCRRLSVRNCRGTTPWRPCRWRRRSRLSRQRLLIMRQSLPIPIFVPRKGDNPLPERRVSRFLAGSAGCGPRRKDISRPVRRYRGRTSCKRRFDWPPYRLAPRWRACCLSSCRGTRTCSMRPLGPWRQCWRPFSSWSMPRG